MSSVLTALLVALPLALGAWPPGAVRRGFHTTPNGALHYVVGGNVTATPPLVFFHAHPRSTEQIKILMTKIPKTQPFIAVDYFGAGSSDECQCDESKDEFVPYTTFAQWVLDICDAEVCGLLASIGLTLELEANSRSLQRLGRPTSRMPLTCCPLSRP